MLSYQIALINYNFDNDYTDCKYFDTPAEQVAYFDSKATSFYSNLVNFNAGNLLNTTQTFKKPNGLDLITLLGSNYAVIKSSNNDYLYYFVTNCSQNIGGQVQVELELDLIQTYVVSQKVTFSQCVIKRGFIDRFKPLPNADGTYSYNFDKNSKLHLAEELDNTFNNRYILSTQDINIKQQFITTNLLRLMQNGWAIFICTKDPTSDIGASGGSTPQKTFTYTVPNVNINYPTTYYIITAPFYPLTYTFGGTTYTYNVNELYKKLSLLDYVTIKFSLIPPIDASDFNNSNFFEGTTIPFCNGLGQTKWYNANGLNSCYFYCEAINIGTAFSEFIMTLPNIDTLLPKTFTTAQIKSQKLQPKSLRSPITVIKIKPFDNEGYNYSPNLISDYQFYLKSTPTFDNIKLFMYNRSSFFEEAYKESVGMLTQADYLLPSASSVWLNYVQSNKAYLLQGLGIPLAQTALTLGLGVATGGVGLAVAGGAGLSSAGQVVNYFTNQYNMKNTPNQQRTNGYSWLNNLGFENTSFKVVVEQIIPSELEQFEKNLYKNGNSLNIIDNIDNYFIMNNFNYIEAYLEEVIGVIPNSAKRKLKDIFAKGIRFWYNDVIDYTTINYEKRFTNGKKET